MVALRKKIDLSQGTEKETRARQMVAARVTAKPGVAGRRMDIVASALVLSENERAGTVRVRWVVQIRAGSKDENSAFGLTATVTVTVK